VSIFAAYVSTIKGYNQTKPIEDQKEEIIGRFPIKYAWNSPKSNQSSQKLIPQQIITKLN